MAISWTTKKQLTFFLGFLAVVAAGAGITAYFLLRPTCLDNKQNQGEAGIDCGGPCATKCIGNPKEMNILWTRAMEISPNKYDLAALVNNPNTNLGASKVSYQFRAYDKENILIGSVDGQTFINPGDRFVVFSPNFEAKKIPNRAFLKFDTIKWKIVSQPDQKLFVVGKNFTNQPMPILKAAISNTGIPAIQNIFVSVVLYDKEKNILGANSVRMDGIEGGETRDAVFTWPKPFSEEPDSIEVLLRTNETN